MRPEHVCYVQFLLPKPVLWTELIFSSTRWNDSLEKRLHCKFHKSKCSVTIAQARYCPHSKYFEYALLFIHEVIDTKGTLASPSTPCTIPGNVIKWQKTSIIATQSHSYRTFWIRQWRLCVFFVPDGRRKEAIFNFLDRGKCIPKVHQWHKQSIARTSLQATCSSLHPWCDDIGATHLRVGKHPSKHILDESFGDLGISVDLWTMMHGSHINLSLLRTAFMKCPHSQPVWLWVRALFVILACLHQHGVI